MNLYQRFTSLASAPTRVILRQRSSRAGEALPTVSCPLRVVKILSINRPHLSSVLHRYRSIVASSLCNSENFSQLPERSFRGGTDRRNTSSRTCVNFVPLSWGNPRNYLLTLFSTRLINTFQRAGMMVWVTDYDFDPKVTNPVVTSAEGHFRGNSVCACLVYSNYQHVIYYQRSSSA